MRTVDPVQWSKEVVKPRTDVARAWRGPRGRVEVMTALERRVRESFSDAVAELMRNCSVTGVSSIIDKRNSRPIRWCYALLVVCALGWCAMLTNRSAGALGGRAALATLPQAAPLPVRRADFPAVALCSRNTVSASQLHTYANYLYSLEKNNTYSMEGLKKNLLAFSGLITSSSLVNFDMNFTKYLAEVARETNVTNIIYKLSPKCESMLVRCAWRGHRARCHSLFASRITDLGYCCVFNARYSLEDRHNLPHRVNMAGQDYGLSIVVKENFDDFTYVRKAGEELEMLIFDGTQYPLKRAGVLRVFPIQRNASVFVTLRAAVQRASDSLRYYTEAWLGCVMSPARSWSRCVAECRRRAVLALCQCSPHTAPRTSRSSEATCSLEHLSCLAKHKDKLTFFYPGENAHESLSVEQADSVECLHCHPDCARLRYSARVWTAPYENPKGLKKAFYNKFLEGVRLENSTVIRIYFTTPHQRVYLVQANLRFYEIVSLLSSHWVFVAGVTVATVVELLYHCTIRWYHHYQRRRRREHNQPTLKEFSQIKL